MAQFVNFLPTPNQEDVARTTTVNFTILIDSYGVQIGTLSVSVNNCEIIHNGSFTDGYTGKILLGSGKYVVGIYPKSPFLPKASVIPVNISVIDDYSTLDSYSYNFTTAGSVVPPPPTPTVIGALRACDVLSAFFPPTDLGLVASFDEGNGTEVELNWKQCNTTSRTNIIYYNVYIGDNKASVFDGYPTFLATNNSVTVGGFIPGQTKYFGVRIGEFSPLLITLSGLIQAGTNLYYYPSTNLSSNITYNATTILVDSVDGFPTRGVIILDNELVYYASLQQSPPGFIVGTNGRGYGSTDAVAHLVGCEVVLYPGKQDSNTNISQATPTYQKPNEALAWVSYKPNCALDGYRDGYNTFDAYQDGSDGYYRYRQETTNSITADGYSNDSAGTFNRQDYCGTYRTLSPASFMKNGCIASYRGGVQRDPTTGEQVRTPNVIDQMYQREELLLETTGEPLVLLRRMWTGIKCTCTMLRREQSDSRCPICFGTSFVQGYIQFFNPRKSDRRILVRIDPTVEDLDIVDRGGLEPKYEPTCWTLAFPMIKDRDVLVRFNENGTEEFRYEILNVTRTRALFGKNGAQKFAMKRFPKTDIIYQYPIMRTTGSLPGALDTSTDSGPGLVAHSHQLIISTGADLTTLRTSTTESQGHNHVVFNGVVQRVLGHNHIII